MTSRHPAVSCACPKCQSERRTTPPPTPAAEEREAVAQWCSGCHEVRSVDCYRADCPKSDTERRAAEILAAEAVARALCIAGEEDDFNYKGYLELADAALSALAPIRAAEILAAEASERARIVAWLRATSTGLDLTNRRIADAIERGEHLT